MIRRKEAPPPGAGSARTKTCCSARATSALPPHGVADPARARERAKNCTRSLPTSSSSTSSPGASSCGWAGTPVSRPATPSRTRRASRTPGATRPRPSRRSSSGSRSRTRSHRVEDEASSSSPCGGAVRGAPAPRARSRASPRPRTPPASGGVAGDERTSAWSPSTQSVAGVVRGRADRQPERPRAVDPERCLALVHDALAPALAERAARARRLGDRRRDFLGTAAREERHLPAPCAVGANPCSAARATRTTHRGRSPARTCPGGTRPGRSRSGGGRSRLRGARRRTRGGCAGSRSRTPVAGRASSSRPGALAAPAAGSSRRRCRSGSPGSKRGSSRTRPSGSVRSAA